MQKSKKGIMLNQAFGAVLTLVLVAILVILAIYMVSSLQGSFSTKVLTTINESGHVNQTGYTLKNMSLCRASGPAIVTIYNTTSGTAIPSGNYSVTSAGIVRNATGEMWNTVKIIYTIDWGAETCNAADSIISQFGTYPTLVGLVGTIIFLALVIGVLVAAFAFGGRKGA